MPPTPAWRCEQIPPAATTVHAAVLPHYSSSLDPVTSARACGLSSTGVFYPALSSAMPAANPEFLRLRAGVQQLLQDLGLLLSELVERPQQQGRPGSALEADQTDEEAHLILDQQLNSFFRAFRGLRARHDDNSLSLAVLALTKSGEVTCLPAPQSALKQRSALSVQAAKHFEPPACVGTGAVLSVLLKGRKPSLACL